VGDIITTDPDTSSGTGLTLQVTEITTAASGTLSKLELTTPGTGYAIASGVGISTSESTTSGTGATIDITEVNATTGAITGWKIASSGSGYAVGDVLSLDMTAFTSATEAEYTVLAVTEVGSIVSTLTTAEGNGYNATNGVETVAVTGSGTGAILDIAADETSESLLKAMQACRAKDGTWYGGFACGATKADHLAIAAWIESTEPTSVYFFNTADSDVVSGADTNVFNMLKSFSYSRTIGQYSTAQVDGKTGTVMNPSYQYAICAIMGYAMGANTGLPSSAYTLMFKNEIGISAEPLTSTQVYNITDDSGGCNGNVYLNYANYYNIFQKGKMSNGYFFDEIINLDVLVSNIQLSLMDLLYQNPKIPQTDSGMTTLMNAVAGCCQTAVNVGFLAPGIWTGANILALKNGDMLPLGYLVQTTPMAEQSQADREARKSTPILVSIKEAGAIHSITVGITVNR